MYTYNVIHSLIKYAILKLAQGTGSITLHNRIACYYASMHTRVSKQLH